MKSKVEIKEIKLVAGDEIFVTAKTGTEIFENYLISNYGRLYSHYYKKIICKKTNRRGYVYYKLYQGGKEKYRYAHRLVAFSFNIKNPNPAKFNIINHIDENPTNNKWDNLEWADDKYNINYGTAQHRRAFKRSMAVVQLDADKKPIAEFISLNEAARKTGFSVTPIFQGCHDGALHKGYYWEYVS